MAKVAFSTHKYQPLVNSMIKLNLWTGEGFDVIAGSDSGHKHVIHIVDFRVFGVLRLYHRLRWRWKAETTSLGKF